MHLSAATATVNDQALLAALDGALDRVRVAILFGSLAKGTARPDSDIDLAVDAGRELSAVDRIAAIDALAVLTGRPVDLVDLRTIGEPLLGQVLRHGRRLRGDDAAWGELYARHIFACTDFLPYRDRILAERRRAWIGK